MLAHTLSLTALESNDKRQPTLELQLARLRAQVAVVRTLADHVEYLARPENADGAASSSSKKWRGWDASSSSWRHR
jgi:hypothetical protein